MGGRAIFEHIRVGKHLQCAKQTTGAGPASLPRWGMQNQGAACYNCHGAHLHLPALGVVLDTSVIRVVGQAAGCDWVLRSSKEHHDDQKILCGGYVDHLLRVLAGPAALCGSNASSSYLLTIDHQSMSSLGLLLTSTGDRT